MKPPPSGLYAILDLGLLRTRGVDVAGAATALVRGGAATLQLRVKGEAGAGEFLALARIVREVARAHGATFLVNDRIDIARLAEADGVHLGQNDLPPRVARAQLGQHALVGLSTHDAAQVAAAQASGADYLGYGPVFATTSKDNPDPVQGTDALRAAVHASALPIVAIGGIALESVSAVRAAGAAAFAVISELFRGDEGPEARARALVEAWRTHEPRSTEGA